MQIVAGTFASGDEARRALGDLEKLGIARSKMNVIEGTDTKGFNREHMATRTAASRGALAGAVFGAGVGAALLLISGVPFPALGPMALYLSGIAICTAGGAAVLGFWNLGISHDEALLFEEARKNGAVIAALEVSEPMENLAIHALEEHGAHDVRSGIFPPSGWHHPHPTDSTAVSHRM